MDSPKYSSHPAAVFEVRDFRLLLAAICLATLASQAMVLVVGYQVYALTKTALSLGLLGLVEAIPAISLALYGGHVADRHVRRTILLSTLATIALCAALLGGLSLTTENRPPLAAFYGAMFIVGIARSFTGPAISALEAQVVPRELIVQSSTWFSVAWLFSSIAGPVLGGLALAQVGAGWTFVAMTALLAGGWITTFQLTPHPVAAKGQTESVWESIAIGVKFVAGNQALLGSMALDLFAVLFGGAIALLPVFADEILKVGPERLGLLNAAPHSGALLTMLLATLYPPMRNAGRNLFAAVIGFGISMLVFGYSRNFYLSLVALFFSGVFDGVSVVIRRAIVRLLSPAHLRGRIAAVSLIFIGSSNELGALESGLAASWLGTARSVRVGGAVTLLVAAITALTAPKLRRLRLDKPAIASTDSLAADIP